jgi:hypothetical protein
MNESGFMWLITIHKPQLSYEQIENIVLTKIHARYFCISTEISETSNSLHYHIFLFSNKPIAFDKIKQEFPTAHIDKCNAKNPRSIRDYVKKSGKWENSDKKNTQIDGDGKFYEYGFLPEYKEASSNWRDYGIALSELTEKVDVILHTITLLYHESPNNGTITK